MLDTDLVLSIHNLEEIMGDKFTKKNISESLDFTRAYEELESIVQKWIDTELTHDDKSAIDFIICLGKYRPAPDAVNGDVKMDQPAHQAHVMVTYFDGHHQLEYEHPLMMSSLHTNKVDALRELIEHFEHDLKVRAWAVSDSWQQTTRNAWTSLRSE